MHEWEERVRETQQNDCNWSKDRGSPSFGQSEVTNKTVEEETVQQDSQAKELAPLSLKKMEKRTMQKKN